MKTQFQSIVVRMRQKWHSGDFISSRLVTLGSIACREDKLARGNGGEATMQMDRFVVEQLNKFYSLACSRFLHTTSVAIITVVKSCFLVASSSYSNAHPPHLVCQR